ncbi:MAG TPA: DUF6079 family protein [Pyrinomonadaceae bacterium]|nr:DUF6079 family protein [Pyrinomonadaceae bacterium]
MRSFQEKVKDIVEVRTHQNLRDFTVDPAETVAGYYFTDGTADLMAKWLDRIAAVEPDEGAAFALAGYRGVGKSHFLATLGALVGHPELRSRVLDPHVAAGAHRLMRRHYPVTFVRRGIQETLFDEFAVALKESLGLDCAEYGNSVPEILKAAAQKAGELPLVLLIDTAHDRATRVTRDDGPFLSEIAEASKTLNIFCGIALDDDIAGADGSNLGISRSFSIDYLDQEHLYKVVNTFVFPKTKNAPPVLSNIYNYFREVLPSFRWSEQRFTSLYPLHPSILEVAPFVRLYVHDFALLGFASTAAERILGRPANSLIGLDEVFDNVERSLRKIPDLQEAFVAYDHLNSEVVGKIPILRRLQAKLVLKALLILSLDGQGTTGGEISAAMLIFDEENPEQAIGIVEDLVQKFADELPEEIQIIAEEGRETRYGFRVSSKDNLNNALADAITQVPDTVVPKVLRRLFQEHFADCTFSSGTDAARKDWMDSSIEWRGGSRRGRIFWLEDDSKDLHEHAATPDLLMDWEVMIDVRTEKDEPFATLPGVSRVHWRPAEMSKDETETILRYYVLSTRTDLREEYSDQIRPVLHSHAVRVGKIASRLFLEDGKLVIDGFDYNCTDEARTSPSLSDLFSVMLEPLFETRYPEHPNFQHRLSMTDVATLISDLYNGSRRNLPEVQQLARVYAEPMGLVSEVDGLFEPRPDDQLVSLPAARDVLARVGETKDGDAVPLREIYDDLRKEPRGFVREAQHLLLTALVAQRQIDFVTSKGDRINQRSLDLKIIWDDIVGIAKPAGAAFSAKRLAKWAALISGAANIKSLDDKNSRTALENALQTWYGEWIKGRVLRRFNELPDDVLNASVWGLASRCSRLLGATAEIVKGGIEHTISLEETINRIADTFSDSEEQFQRTQSELVILDSFIKGAPMRSEVLSYLSGCEISNAEEIEEMREELYHLVDVSYRNPSDASNRELSYLWMKFRRDFADHFAAKHDAIMRSHSLQASYNEIMRSDDWWEFENLSRIPMLHSSRTIEVKDLTRRLAEVDCKFAVRDALEARPFCRCSFGLSDEASWEELPQQLEASIARAVRSYRETLLGEQQSILPLLADVERGSGDSNAATAATALIESIRRGEELPRFSSIQLQVLQRALARHPHPSDNPVAIGDRMRVDLGEDLVVG